MAFNRSHLVSREFIAKFHRQKYVRNFASLMGVQLIINLSSLVLVPILSRSLGAELWGLYILSQSLTVFSSILVDFGLDYTATRSVSQNKQNTKFLSEISGSVLIIKFSISLIVIVIASGIYLSYPPFQNHPEYLFLGVLIGIFSGLTPWWFFQGIEKMIYPSTISIILYLIYSASVILIVDGPEDGWKVLFGYLILGFLINLILHVKIYGQLNFSLPKYSAIRELSKQSFILFLVKFSESIYSSVNIIILGGYVSSTKVSFYGNSQKVLKIPRITINNLVRALYPKISLMSREDSSKARIVKWKIIIWTCLSSLIGSILIFLFSEEIIILIFGEAYTQGIIILKWTVWTVPLFAFNKIISVLGLAAFNKDKVYLKITMISVLINLVLLIFFLELYGLIGIAYSFLLSELSNSIILIGHFKKGEFS